jgi:hypothetical protein
MSLPIPVFGLKRSSVEISGTKADTQRNVSKQTLAELKFEDAEFFRLLATIYKRIKFHLLR